MLEYSELEKDNVVIELKRRVLKAMKNFEIDIKRYGSATIANSYTNSQYEQIKYYFILEGYILAKIISSDKYNWEDISFIANKICYDEGE